MTESNPEITDGSLETLREENEKLRADIEAQKSRAATAAHTNELELEYAQLVTEQVRLQGELTAATAMADSVEAKEGSEGIFDSLKSQLTAAVQQSNAPVGAVDTNVAVEPESEVKPDVEPDVETTVEQSNPESDPPVGAPTSTSSDPTSPPPSSPSGDSDSFFTTL